MRLDLCYGTRESMRTVSVRSDVTLAAAQKAVDRLRAWADPRHFTAAGEPFMRLHSVLSAVVHLPLAVDEMDVSPESGLASDRVASGPIIAAGSVPFEAFRGIARNLQYEFGSSCRLTGPVEFRAEGGDFESGTVILPVEALPKEQPQFIQVPS